MGGIHRLGMSKDLNSPYGGTLIYLKVSADHAAELKAQSRNLVSVDFPPRQLADLEMLATGVFSPIQSFMG
ncbi:MAG TPA: hypothetical protein VIR61_01420 [Sulfuricaulis sp.]